jgi:hypothetical protein
MQTCPYYYQISKRLKKNSALEMKKVPYPPSICPPLSLSVSPRRSS